jgi:hypothetical protein
MNTKTLTLISISWLYGILLALNKKGGVSKLPETQIPSGLTEYQQGHVVDGEPRTKGGRNCPTTLEVDYVTPSENYIPTSPGRLSRWGKGREEDHETAGDGGDLMDDMKSMGYSIKDSFLTS